jgi:hypothetical protein
MAGFDGLIKGLRHAERTLESQLSSIRSAISTLTEGGRQFMEDVTDLDASPSAAPRKRRRRRRKLSPEGRAAIAAAQKKRWARIKAAQKSKKAESSART